jgi:hypothetical protein
MRKLDLRDWAALGELVAALAVIVSLVFVVISINQNTNALQGLNDNAIFDQHIALMNHIVADPSMAAIYAKKRSGETPLTEIESIRWERYQSNLLDIWVMAFTRHETGLLADEHWDPWNTYFIEQFRSGPERLTRERWDELVYGFEPDFWHHVDRAVFGADSKDHDPADR